MHFGSWTWTSVDHSTTHLLPNLPKPPITPDGSVSLCPSGVPPLRKGPEFSFLLLLFACMHLATSFPLANGVSSVLSEGRRRLVGIRGFIPPPFFLLFLLLSLPPSTSLPFTSCVSFSLFSPGCAAPAEDTPLEDFERREKELIISLLNFGNDGLTTRYYCYLFYKFIIMYIQP